MNYVWEFGSFLNFARYDVSYIVIDNLVLYIPRLSANDGQAPYKLCGEIKSTKLSTFWLHVLFHVFSPLGK